MRLAATLLLLIYLVSCGEDISFDATRVIVNESNSDVRIEVYQDGNSIESISISAGSKNERLTSCDNGVGRIECTPDLQWASFADSALVIFDETRIQTFCGFGQDCNQGPRNIMDLVIRLNDNDLSELGYVKTMEGDNHVYTYTITEEDYQNAVPVGG